MIQAAQSGDVWKRLVVDACPAAGSPPRVSCLLISGNNHTAVGMGCWARRPARRFTVNDIRRVKVRRVCSTGARIRDLILPHRGRWRELGERGGSRRSPDGSASGSLRPGSRQISERPRGCVAWRSLRYRHLGLRSLFCLWVSPARGWAADWLTRAPRRGNASAVIPAAAQDAQLLGHRPAC